MEYYGRRSVVKSWISSYLSSRNSLHKSIIYSNLSRSKCGAPQGTILGPKPFITLINDILMCRMWLNLLFLLMTQVYSALGTILGS